MPDAPAHLRRDLFRSSLELLLLSQLADGPRHGYNLAQKLTAATGETLSPGTLYPLLQTIEAQGWATTSTQQHHGRRRKRYTLTPKGEDRLKAAATEWQAAIARMQGVVLPALRQTVQHPRANRATSVPST